MDHVTAHNAWSYYGRDYLARVVALQTLGTVDVPQVDKRIRYLGLGMGGTGGPLGLPADVAQEYPAGGDPNATSGREYNCRDMVNPPVATLERPVRRAGSRLPYGSAPQSDVWLFDDIETRFLDTQSVTFSFVVDCEAGDVVYGGRGPTPISEAGLFHAGASVNNPFNMLVAYVNFGTLYLLEDSVLTLSWTVRFAQ